MVVSKAVRDKDPVVIRTEKIIRCPKNRQPLGYYTTGRYYKVMTVLGETLEFDIPAGISLERGPDGALKVELPGGPRFIPTYSGGPQPIL